MKVITIPNLDNYQHYKERSIIWIKWYVDSVQDYKFCQLENDERWLFIGLIVLAVKNDNKVPFDVHFIAEKVCFRQKNNLKHTNKLSKSILKMKKIGLISIEMLATCYQPASPEEKRVEKKRREESSSFNKNKKPYYNGLSMVKKFGKWMVIPKDGGTWLDFNDKEDKIEWK